MTDFNRPGDHSSAAVARPPLTLYEVRTTHGEAYWAEGDVIEQGDGWFTLWASEMVIALRLPEADIRAVRSVTEGEREAESGSERLSNPALACPTGQHHLHPLFSCSEVDSQQRAINKRIAPASEEGDAP
ncbi:hypothetical protein [Streptomyces sp. NRRL B-24720]|uniref:hypothetical protein n=1 Tax=Streptomyces sp. NRRL B-24720 TaxID=1476876 RepID=UPI0004C8353A|nr:hypothetical protein [Streptomyces sp. NRRL B-24720]